MYSRMLLGDTIRKVGRADHVEKLLSLTEHFKKKSSAAETQSGSEDSSPQKSDKRKQRFEKINAFAAIQKLKIEDAENAKLGLKSFEVLDTLGKGSFG